MPRSGGTAFRTSRASSDLRVVNNFPGRYPVEGWRAYYWAVADDGSPHERYVTVQLPQGYAGACSPVEWGEAGDLKGSCISGISDLGALAWMATGGRILWPGPFPGPSGSGRWVACGGLLPLGLTSCGVPRFRYRRGQGGCAIPLPAARPSRRRRYNGRRGRQSRQGRPIEGPGRRRPRPG